MHSHPLNPLVQLSALKTPSTYPPKGHVWAPVTPQEWESIFVS